MHKAEILVMISRTMVHFFSFRCLRLSEMLANMAVARFPDNSFMRTCFLVLLNKTLVGSYSAFDTL